MPSTALPPLNFPIPYALELRPAEEPSEVFDPIRRRHVALTPEEWVRQHMLRYLIDDRGYSAALTSVEKGFDVDGLPYRADIVVHNRKGEAIIAVECKAPDVKINQRTFDQLGRYNRVIGAPYLLVTNGLQHYCAGIDRETATLRILDEIPRAEKNT